MNGWLNIDKPLEYSSAKVVNIIKRFFKKVKIGHAGTLDPLATGILPIAIGEATKLISIMMDAEKTYEFIIEFGTQTETDDAEGKIIATTDYLPHPDELKDISSKFIGFIKQTPSKFSAIKINGQRAYDLARQGEDFIMPEREIEIKELTLLSDPLNNKEAKFKVVCSKGTYVRSLARDISLKLNSLGYVKYLRRTQVGIFSEFSVITLDNLEKLVHNDRQQEALLPMESILDDIPAIEIGEEKSKLIKYGQQITFEHTDVNQACVMFNEKLQAIGIIENNLFKPKRVFNT